MDKHGFHDSGWYPHDGEGKGMCPGPGCNCDERNYGYRGGGGRKHNSDGDGVGVWLVMLVGLVIGVSYNELIGSMIIIGAIIYLIFH